MCGGTVPDSGYVRYIRCMVGLYLIAGMLGILGVWWDCTLWRVCWVCWVCGGTVPDSGYVGYVGCVVWSSVVFSPLPTQHLHPREHWVGTAQVVRILAQIFKLFNVYQCSTRLFLRIFKTICQNYQHRPAVPEESENPFEKCSKPALSSKNATLAMRYIL